jgi:hypothetical protein
LNAIGWQGLGKHMAGSKRAPEARSKPSCKCTVINLEKIKIILHNGGWQSLPAITREPGFMVSNVNTI